MNVTIQLPKYEPINTNYVHMIPTEISCELSDENTWTTKLSRTAGYEFTLDLKINLGDEINKEEILKCIHQIGNKLQKFTWEGTNDNT